MPKLSIHLDEWNVTEAIKREWRQAYVVDGPTPFDERTMKALIAGLVKSFNEAVERAIVEYPESDGVAHLSVFHPADGWVPLCKSGMYVTDNCLECSNKAKPHD